MRTILLLAALSLMIGCGKNSDDKRRFTQVDYGFATNGGDGCVIHVITDQDTGCEYLLSCNSITAMPHTCKQDRLTGGPIN